MDVRYLSLVLMFASVSAMAGEYSVTMVDTPNRITVPGGVGLSVYSIGSRETRRQLSGKVVSIEWSTTSYPQSVGEEVELCFRVYKGETPCVPIAPGTSGISYEFQGESFFPGAGVNIRHKTKEGGQRNSRPSGQDRIKFNVIE
jgi:hypothetical protein